MSQVNRVVRHVTRALPKYQRPAREITIWKGSSVVDKREATSLRKALISFARDQGFNRPLVTGNLLLVGEDVDVYVALDAGQRPDA